MSSADSEEVEGSWIPFVLLTILFLMRWVVYGEGAVGIRRWYNMRVSYMLVLYVIVDLFTLRYALTQP